MPIDIARARAATPGVAHVAHLNNAGAALPPQIVLDVVIDHLRREGTIGGYEAAAEAAQRIDAVYDSIATLIGAEPAEIALVESATTAWNSAFAAVPLRPGDRVLTGRTEYVSNAINLLIAQQRHGIEVVLIEDDRDGQISLDHLRASIDERVKLIALTHVPTGGGLVNPAVEVGAIAREAGVLYLLDACQSVGQMEINVDVVGCDILTATGRKFLRGPRGTGFLYVRERALDRLAPHQLDVRSATWTAPDHYEIEPGARRFELWEASIAGRLGLGAAADHALEWGLADIGERCTTLADRLRALLVTVPRARVFDQGQRRCAIVTFDIEGIPSADVQRALSEQRVNTSLTSIRYSQFDFAERGLDQLIRASPHYYNSDDEIARLVEVVAALAT